MSRRDRYKKAQREQRTFSARNNRPTLPPPCRALATCEQPHADVRCRHRQAVKLFDALYMQHHGCHKLPSGPAILLPAPVPVYLIPATCLKREPLVLSGDVFVSNEGPVTTDDVKARAWKRHISHAEARAELAATGKPLHPKVAKALERDVLKPHSLEDSMKAIQDAFWEGYRQVEEKQRDSAK